MNFCWLFRWLEMWLMFYHKPWESRETTAQAREEDEAAEEMKRHPWAVTPRLGW